MVKFMSCVFFWRSVVALSILYWILEGESQGTMSYMKTQPEFSSVVGHVLGKKSGRVGSLLTRIFKSQETYP